MDPEPTSYFYSFLSIGALILINGMFVAAEYALISFNPSKLNPDSDKNERNKDNDATFWLLHHSELCVASIQLGITLCSLTIGYLGLGYFYSIVGPFVSSTFESFSIFSGVPFLLSFTLALILLTFVHVIFGELFVKAISTAFPEATLRFLAPVMKIFTQLTYPISAAAYMLANLFLKPFQLTIKHADNAVLSLAEIKRLFSSVPSTSEIGTDQARMIRGVVGFSETIAREVMTPRTDLVTVKVDSTLEEVTSIILEAGFSRYPVRGDRVDDVLGILLARDVVPYIVSNEGMNKPSFEVRKVMRQPYYIPGTKAIDELLNEFRKRKHHMAIILDEHGGVDGVVTMEDIIEEIVGDIYDESDEPEANFRHDLNGDLLVGGGVLVADLNEKFALSIPEGQYDTIAGFIFTCLGQIPKRSDKIFVTSDNDLYINGQPEKSSNGASNGNEPSESDEGILISVDKVDGHRIELVRLHFIKEIVDGEKMLASNESETTVGSSQLKSVLVN
jgi:putative hemolysin